MSKLDCSMIPLKDVIFNNQEVFAQKFNDLVNDLLQVFRTHSPGTLGPALAKISNHDSQTLCVDACHKVLHQKHYIDTTMEKRSFDDMNVEESMDDIDSSDIEDDNRKKRLVSHSRLIHLFWEYCDGKIDYTLRILMDVRIPKILDLKPFNVKTAIEAFRTTYFSVWKVLQPLFPILQYVYLNYPHIFQKNVSNDATFDDYINKKIYDTFKNKLNQTDTSFEGFLKASFLPFISDEQWINAMYNKTSLLRFAFLYNEKIDGKQLEHYYFLQLQKHLRSFDYKEYFYQKGEGSSKKSNFELNFLRELRNQTLLAYMFSPTWMGTVTTKYVQNVIMNHDMIAECYKCYKNTNLGSYNIEENNDIGLFRYAYISRNQKEKVDQICENIIYDEIKHLYNPADKLSLLKVFDRFRYQVIFFSRIEPVVNYRCNCDYDCECYNGKVPEFFDSAYTKFFGNEIKLIQAILKYIELKEKLSLTHNADISHLYEDLEIILKKLSISSSITTLYSESLFRHILMNYEILIEQISLQDDAMKTIDDVVTVFSNVYKGKLENVSSMWQHFKEHAIKVSRTKADYIDNFRINPFMLPLADIPQAYQQINEENTLSNIKLPKELQDMWDGFKAEYLDAVLPQASNKTVQLMYGLQYCDVETQFLTKNGVPLHLELTLYQTCVLNEFNQHDNVCFSYLVDTLKIDPLNLKPILNSFLNIGLIEVNADKSFSVNESFKANEKKVKNDTLRVVIGKVRNAPLRRSTPNVGLATTFHPEGPGSVWRREVIKAYIVRNLKHNMNRSAPIDQNMLYENCLTWNKDVTRIEFKEALESAVKEDYIHKTNDDKYSYID